MVSRLALSLLALLVVPAILRSQETAGGDKRDRIRRAQDLGKQDSQAIPALQAMLADAEIEVRVEAVKSIIRIGTQHSLDPLLQATRDSDPEMQFRAADGLVNFYYPGYMETGLSASLKRVGNAIKAKFTDTTDKVIDPFVEVRPEVIDTLGKLARGGISMEVRANAARAVGVLRGRQAIPDLVQALRSKDSIVIYEVLIALQKIRDPEAAPQISFLLRDLDEKVQVAAIETTGLLRNKSALPDLRNVLERTKSKKVRRAAVTAIAMLPDESSRPLFSQYLQDKDEELRAAAAEGFGRLKNAADVPALEKAFNAESKMKPRLSLAFALVSLGSTEMSEFSPLQYLVNTLNKTAYRGIAQPFLEELTRTPVVRKALYAGIERRTRDEKIGLAGILALSGDAETVPVLEALSRDTDARVAQEGTRAFRVLKSRLP